jgi:hypothetical protein
LFGSLVVSVHCCWHAICVPGQDAAQAPPEQTSVIPQATPQPPQLSGSEPRVTHAVPQAT